MGLYLPLRLLPPLPDCPADPGLHLLAEDIPGEMLLSARSNDAETLGGGGQIQDPRVSSLLRKPLPLTAGRCRSWAAPHIRPVGTRTGGHGNDVLSLSKPL